MADGAPSASAAGSSHAPHPRDAIFLSPDDIVEEIELESRVGDDASSVISTSTAAGASLAPESVTSDPLPDDIQSLPHPAGIDTSVWRYAGHGGPVYALSAAKGVIASSSGDDTAHVWRVGVDLPVARLVGHADSVVCVALNSNASRVATGGLDGSVRVWSLPSGSCSDTVEVGGEVAFLVWHPKGEVVLAGASDGTIWMWSCDAGSGSLTCMAVCVATSPVTCGNFNSSGRVIVTGERDGSVRVWSPLTGACTQHVAGHDWHEDEVNSVVSSRDAPLLLSTSQDGTARVCSSVTGKHVATLRHPYTPPVGEHDDADADGDDDAPHASVESAAFCPVSPHIVSGDTDGVVCVWDAHTYALLHSSTHEEAVIRMLFLHDSPRLVLALANGCVKVMDVRDGRTLQTFTGHAGMVLDIAIMRPVAAGEGGEVDTLTPAARAAHAWVITAGEDCTCRVYAVEP